jgi:hypothetical protein
MVCRVAAAYHYMQQAHLHVEAPCYLAWAQISCVVAVTSQLSGVDGTPHMFLGCMLPM